MGYYAIMIDIKQAEEEIAEKIDEWMTQICQMNAVLSSYCTDLQERCSGELVDAICCYVKDVYQELLEQFMILFIEMQERIVCYAEGYYEIEDDIGTGEIAQWSLENQKLILQNEKESFFLETEELEKYLSEISDIISMDAPSTTAVESGFGELTKYADDLLTTIGEYEEKHKSEDFEVMEEMIDSLSKLIEDLSGKKQVELREYKSEDILKHPEVERLKTVDDEFFSLRESDKKRLEIMEEYHLQQQIEERKNQGKLKFLNGVLLVAGAVGTIAVVVVSMGGATPAVAGIWGNIIIGGSSTMTTIYGVSETIEGINLYELGKEGDVQTVAGNPVRDIVFGGDEKLYHKWGEANVLISQFTMGGSSLVNLAKSQGINAAMLEVGKIAGSGVVGDMAYQYMVEEAGMSEVDAMLLGMVTSELTYGGLNLLHGNVLSRQNVNTVKGGKYSSFGEMSEADGIKYSNWMKVREGELYTNYVQAGKELSTKLEVDGYKILKMEDATIANADWYDMGFDKPPIAEKTIAYTVEAGNHSYSRVFLEGYNNPMSTFIIRTDDIAGLNAQEIAEKLALPKVPNRVVEVELPPSTPLEVSITGPQPDWGTIGGDVQFAIKDVDLNPQWFTNIKILE